MSARSQTATATPEALLVSADLPDLTPSLLSRARSHGLRLVGIATDEHDTTLLRELPLDTILTDPIDAHALQAAVRVDRLLRSSNGAAERRPTCDRHTPRPRSGEGTVLAVVGSRGAPGSERACLLARRARIRRSGGRCWSSSTCSATPASRSGSAPTRARDRCSRCCAPLAAASAALGELLERWLVSRDRLAADAARTARSRSR